MSPGRICKFVSLIFVLGIFAWLLRPPSDEEMERDANLSLQTSLKASDTKYVIKFAPGIFYMPDSTPYDLGKPLQGLKGVVREFERRFPDTQIEILTVPGRREYLVTQLSSGQAPDIINVNVEDVWIDVQKGWYIPLDTFLESPNPFVLEKGDPDLPGATQWWDMFKYQAISRGKAAPDNKNYCLTFDLIETGIFYNKDIFREVGITEPTDWEDFIHILQKIQAAGYTPLLMNIWSFNDWCKDLFFDQLYYGILPGIDLYKDPIREEYLQGYLDWDELAFLYEKGFFNAEDPRYVEIWRQMRRLKEYTNDDLVSTDLTREFVTQRAAMLWMHSMMTWRLVADRQLGFDWGVFYLPRFTQETSPYASGEDMCVIGGSATQIEVTNSAVSDTNVEWTLEERMARSRRLERVIQFLQFLCLPEQYEKVVNEYAALIPNIVGVTPREEIEPFRIILEGRYTTTKWVFTFDLRFSDIQQRALSLYLTGGSDLDEFLSWQVGNLDYAVSNLLKRKSVDRDQLEKAWRELAAIRSQARDLPSTVLEGDQNL